MGRIKKKKNYDEGIERFAPTEMEAGLRRKSVI